MNGEGKDGRTDYCRGEWRGAVWFNLSDDFVSTLKTRPSERVSTKVRKEKRNKSHYNMMQHRSERTRVVKDRRSGMFGAFSRDGSLHSTKLNKNHLTPPPPPPHRPWAARRVQRLVHQQTSR